MKIHIGTESQEDMTADGWRIIATLPPCITQEKIDNIRQHMGTQPVWFTRHSNGEHEQILVWTMSSEVCKTYVRTGFLRMLPSILCLLLALYFFAWADWRILVAVLLVWISKLNVRESLAAMRAGIRVGKGGSK